MGGTIWFESVENAGTTFHVVLKLLLSESVADKGAGQRPLSTRRVLVLASAPSVRDVRTQQLLWWGAEVVAAGSINEAATLPRSFDAALVDLPGEVDTVLACRERVQTAGLGDLPLVLCVPLTQELHDAEAAQNIRLVRKPVRQSQLAAALMSLFSPNVAARKDTQTTLFDESFAERVPLRILLAEDNLVNQKVALQMLTRLGYTTDVVSNGQEAVDALIRQQYDLVLMDVQMPEMDGIAAARIVRTRLPALQQPVIVAMTAAASVEDRRACAQAGMDGFLSKPFQPQELLDALVNAGATAGMRRRATEPASSHPR